MNIEKIKKQKSGKYLIELDNHTKLQLYEDVILDNGLLFKKNIDSDLYNKLNLENNYYDIYNKTLKYISTKMRSEVEINKYLDKLGCLEKEKIIKKLKSINLINDDLYLKAYISDKMCLTLNGPNKIRKELLEHNIELAKINEELEKYENTYHERINKIISKKIKSNNKSIYMFKQKMINELIESGYDKEEIIKELDNYNIDETNNIKKDYEILLKKLSKKYQNEELKYQLKNKLYSKGYNYDSIKEIVK